MSLGGGRAYTRFPALQSCSHGEHIKCSPARAELAMNLTFRAVRADASVLKHGLSWGNLLNIYKLKATSCGLLCIRKACPRIHVWSGMQLPLAAPSGNRIPFQAQIPGRTFRQTSQPETTSRSKGKFRDALSEPPSTRKARPALGTSGHGIISLLGLPSIKGRPPGRRARSSSRVPHAKEAT